MGERKKNQLGVYILWKIYLSRVVFCSLVCIVKNKLDMSCCRRDRSSAIWMCHCFIIASGSGGLYSLRWEWSLTRDLIRRISMREGS